MTTIRAPCFVCVSLLLGLASAGPAKAALEWEFSASGPDMEASGVIQFAVDECDTGCLFDVVDFSVEGSSFDHDYSCEGILCLDEAVWEILPDWELGFLAFQTIVFESDTAFVAVDLLLQSDLGASSACFDSLSTRCGEFSSNIADADEFEISPIHVPEPATLTLFVGGLVGLLGWAWRRRRSSASLIDHLRP